MNGGDTVVEVHDVSMRFAGFTAVRNCSLAVSGGSITALIGPNGAGKTTLFNIIGGALAPTSGSVFVNGLDVSAAPAHRRCAAGLIRTFQIPRAFHRMTLLENLLVSPPGQSGTRLGRVVFNWRRVINEEARHVERAREVLDYLELSHVASEMAGNLSGGQKKLLELGRALMSGAKIVLLDEPAAGVNRRLLGALGDKIAELRRDHGYTFFIVEHDLAFVGRLCDHVIVLAHGDVLTEGTMDDVRAHPDVIEAYLGTRPDAVKHR